MQTTEMNFLSWFKTSDVYNPDTLASDEEAIRKYYMRYGYADFRIANTAVVYKPRRNGYVITISVDEGPHYHVSSVNGDIAADAGSTAPRWSITSPSIPATSTTRRRWTSRSRR